MPAEAPSLAPISTVDILTPIHKALRSMIYDLASRLQSTDWTDAAATEAVLADLRYEFGAGVPARCVLCLLHAHAGHEETVFPQIRSHDAPLIDELLEDHRDFARRLGAAEALGGELRKAAEAERRRALGKELNQHLNDFFARYLAHMNREETALVPLLNRRLTDGQLIGIRTMVERSMPPERMQEMLRWMMRSLDANELTDLLAGARRAAPPEQFASLRALAETTVDPARWQVVRSRTGL
jgi:hypothetical protein